MSKNPKRFRVGSHCLPVETGRWCQKKKEDRICDVCGTPGDEHHYLYDCPTIPRADLNLDPDVSKIWWQPEVFMLIGRLKSQDLLWRSVRFLLGIFHTLLTWWTWMGLVFPGFAIFAYPGFTSFLFRPRGQAWIFRILICQARMVISHAQVLGLNVSYSASLSLGCRFDVSFSSLILTFRIRVDFSSIHFDMPTQNRKLFWYLSLAHSCIYF